MKFSNGLIKRPFINTSISFHHFHTKKTDSTESCVVVVVGGGGQVVVLLEVCVGPVSLGDGSALLGHPLGERELDLGVVHLHHVGTAALSSGNNLHTDDLDSVGTGSVSSSHVPVALSDSLGDGEVPVLSVHVVGAGPGVISQPDAEVLHSH